MTQPAPLKPGFWAGLTRWWRKLTAGAAPPPAAESDVPIFVPVLFTTESAELTDVGLKRSHNEDAVLNAPGIGVWAVADGVGGHEAGDVASNTVVKALAAVPLEGSVAQRGRALSAAIRSAHAELRAESARRQGKIIGTTVVALMVTGGRYSCLWSGDSRIYRLRQGELQQLTRDHSLVQDLIDSGALSEAEAEFHPQRNIVTQAVGAEGEVQFELIDGQIEAGDRFLLCSDGLTKMVPNTKIAMVLAEAAPKPAAEQLVALALEAGGADNVSVVVVHCTPLVLGDRPQTARAAG